MMNTAEANVMTKQLVLNEKSCETKYLLAFKDCIDNSLKDDDLIIVDDKKDIELLLFCLGKTGAIYMNDKARKENAEVWNWLYEKTMDDLLMELKCPFKDIDQLQKQVKKIPVEKERYLRENNTFKNSIHQKYVHKWNKENVLISAPHPFGNMFYFQGFSETTEFVIEHPSDHLEGIVLFEVIRQSCMATVHLSEVPFAGRIIMLKTEIDYIKFVELGKPYYIRTIPIVKAKGGSCIVLFDVIQNDGVCASGKFSGFSFKNQEQYEKFRK